MKLDDLPNWLRQSMQGTFFRPAARGRIGLDLGLSLNMVQMMRTGGSGKELGIRAALSIAGAATPEGPCTDPKRLKSLLKQAYAMEPFEGRQVVSCLPAQQLKIVTVAYKHCDAQPDGVTIVGELRERLKGDVADMVIDYMPLRQEASESDQAEAIVAMAPRDKVIAHLDLLTDAGLEVGALDVGPAALTRLVNQLNQRRNGDGIDETSVVRYPNVLLINLGATGSFLTVIFGRRLMLDRPVDFSEGGLLARLKRVLDLPDDMAIGLLHHHGRAADDCAEASGPSNEIAQTVIEVLKPEVATLVQEINSTLNYVASKTHGQAIDTIYLVGLANHYQGIRTLLGELLQVPVDVLDPLANFAWRTRDAGPRDLGVMPGIALATGLALRGISEHG